MRWRGGRFVLFEQWWRDGELMGVTLVRCTWWFQVTLAVKAWAFGYSVERTYTISPSRTIAIAIIPGLVITVGIQRIKT